MANTFTIKRGAGAPADGVLEAFELGYDKTNNNLYIGLENGTACLLTDRNKYLPLSGGTLTGNLRIDSTNNFNPNVSLKHPNATDPFYFQVWTDGSEVKGGLGFRWANSLIIDSTGVVTLKGNLILDEPAITTAEQASGEPYIKWPTYNDNTPYIGFASNQIDGTFIVASLKGTAHNTGLSIGGGSGNLLWKGDKVATIYDNVASATYADTADTANSATKATVAAELGNSCQATHTKNQNNTSHEITIDTAITTIPLNYFSSHKNGLFSFDTNTNGIICPYSGTIFVTANIYIYNVPTGNNKIGCYIYKKNNTEEVEIISQYIGSFGAGTVSSGGVIVEVEENDIIILKGRSSVSGAKVVTNLSQISIIYI